MRNILAILLCSAALASAQAPRRAPGFALPDPTMHFHDLADYHGKVLVLEFMRTTCPHCIRFGEILAELGSKYGNKVAVLAVTNVNTDNPPQIVQYISEHKIGYPILMDQGQMMFSYILSPKGADVPHVYIIDPNGNIRADYVYSITTHDIFEGQGLFAEIDKVLAKK